MENQKTTLDKFAEFIGTVLGVTEDRFQKILDEFIVNQDYGKKEAEDFSNKMKSIYDTNKTKLLSLVDESVKKTLSKVDIARVSEIKELEEKIKTLEEKLNAHTHVHSGAHMHAERKTRNCRHKK